MTEHLGDRVSPLIDHQLDHDARDRALAHLAGCADCQREVVALRQVKARLVALGDPALPDDVAARLLRIGAGMVGPARPEPERRRSLPRTGRIRSERRLDAPRPDRPRADEAATGTASPSNAMLSRGSASAAAAVPANGAVPSAGAVPGAGEPQSNRTAGGPPPSPSLPSGREPEQPDAADLGRPEAQPPERVASRRRPRRRAPDLPGGPGRGPRAASSPGAGHRPGPGPGGSRRRLRRPSSPPPRPVQGRSSMRRTLLSSAALLMLAVTGAAVADGRGNARPAGPIAVPTVSSVVAPGSPAGGSLRLIPMFAPMKVSLRR
ncbi:anti-sigma factor [Frankia sp. QA3]|uniref:anti-sigma factor family protein n=1 Tax=Frankia sp. QA3 TaxID=710111 RepID=UPI000269CDC7|nr:zf-HC2 domain-containing protein [Frankia sp. QA3]EIV95689.1 hypothetical protein FraQA3DRAFT_5532 [Frankia sp. QA3]